MQNYDADAVIIGGGAMGLSTAYYLSQKGYKNIYVLEQNSSMGGDSTLRCAGGFRHQFSSQANIELSLLSYELFQKMFSENENYYDACGYMFLLTKEQELDEFAKSVSLQNSLGIKTEWLETNQIKRKIPFINTKPILAATYYQKDGLIDVGAIISKYLSYLDESDVKLMTDCRVKNIETHDSKIKSVDIIGGRINTPILVNAAGAYSRKINSLLGVDLPVQPLKQQLFTTTEADWIPQDLPVAIYSSGLGFHKEGRGLLSGLHREIAQEDNQHRKVNREWEFVHCRKLVEALEPAGDLGIHSRWAGFYDMTADFNPIIGEDNEINGLYYLTGFSGHGFMHSFAAGYLMSELIMKQPLSVDITSFRIERFRDKTSYKKELFKV